MTTLRGFCVRHARILPPMIAAGQSYADTHPGTTVLWGPDAGARPIPVAAAPLDSDPVVLAEQGEESIASIMAEYDFIAYDTRTWLQPFADRGVFVPLDDHLDAAFLADQAAGSIGQSYLMGSYAGHQWSLPLDAGAQVAAYRPDLLNTLPATWDDVIDLAKATRKVGIALFHYEAARKFWTLCGHLAGTLDSNLPLLVPRPVAEEALRLLLALVVHCDPGCFQLNTLRSLDRMATTDDLIYQPLVGGYACYSRANYQATELRFSDIPDAGAGSPRGSAIGGYSIAVSAKSANLPAALAYLRYLLTDSCQRVTMASIGGQPARRAVWDDDIANATSGDFFRSTRATFDAAIPRPVETWHRTFEARTSRLLVECLRGERGVGETLDGFEAEYRQARR